MRTFGLIGYPLSHSFSQRYFSEKFRRENIADARYENFSIASIEMLPQVLDQNPGIAGLNVTIPYKQSVIAWLDKPSSLPIPACNCIRLEKGKMIGFNTDIAGFEQSLTPGLQPYHDHALILGNGGATEAVKFVLKKLGIYFSVVSRNTREDRMLSYEDINQEIILQHPLIINATPLGMFPNVEEYPKIPYEYLTEKHYLFDLIYNPEETVFLKKGKDRGARVKNGQEMLTIQAEESWRIWNQR